MREIVLASTSEYRKQLMKRLRIPFVAAPPGVDEEVFKRRAESPEELVRLLSVAKARTLSAHFPNALIIGSDQCAEIEGDILDKPGSRARAVDQLARLVGKTHRLLTGVCLLDAKTGKATVDVDEHRLTMRPLSAEQIERYVKMDSPLDCAGAYKIESLGVTLFETIEGTDGTAIIGLPLMRLTRRLLDAGVDVLGRR